MREAMSCGMPVINTQGNPWDELPALARIKSTVSRVKVRRQVDWHTPDVKDMLRITKILLGSDISRQSMAARQWADRNSFRQKKDELTDIVRYGTPTKNQTLT